jgi:hypothetical protein
MNVLTIGLGTGSVGSPSGPQTSGETPLPTARASAPATATAVASAPSGPEVGTDVFARVAWFDLNGDGHIDNRSPMSGGDGTLLVPKHSVDTPTYTRSARRSDVKVSHGGNGNVASVKVNDSGPAVATSDVQTRQAINAYQRYGSPADNLTTDRAVA